MKKTLFTAQFFIWMKLLLPFFAIIASSHSTASLRVSQGGSHNVRMNPHVIVRMVSEKNTVKPGKDAWIGFHFQIEKGWHLYWINPGDSGSSPKVNWDLPQGVRVGEFLWPTPERIPYRNLINYGYSQSLLLMAPLHIISPPSFPLILNAKVKWLACREICIPGKADLSYTLHTSESEPVPSSDIHLFQNYRAQIPGPLPSSWRLSANESKEGFELILNATLLPKESSQIYFYAQNQYLIDSKDPQKVSWSQNSIRISLKKSENFNISPSRLTGVLQIDKKAFQLDIPLQKPHSPPQSQGVFDLFFIQVLFMAFLGGLILNLMPCVFPVLSIKALNVVEQFQEKDTRKIKIHSLVYTLGILVSFWFFSIILSLFKAGGESLGWGFQLQSPVFVSILICLLYFMSLNLFGIFEIGSSLLGTGGSLALRKGYPGTFFTGVLATVVATPCMAPFMGTALAFALGQKAWISLGVFTFLGFGLAFPYVLISFIPAIGRILPKPGLWMETFKQIMAFPILATVIWLIWVLGKEGGADSIVKVLWGLFMLSLSAWILGRWKSRVTQAVAGVFIVLGIIFGVFGQSHQIPPHSNEVSKGPWEEFSKEKLEAYQNLGKPVFIDFTAAWCVTCKVNEKVAFTSSVMHAFASKGIVLMQGDWTHSNPEITRALEEFGRNGVPLYVFYTGKKDEAPHILPQILTPQIVMKEINLLN